MSNRRGSNLKPGDFPFPLTEGASESGYLTWLRNNSNYMAVRGLLDYARAIAILIRGILINLLIFTPFLLGIALIVAASNFLQAPPSFILTKGLAILFAAWILLFPLMTPLFRIVRYQKSRGSGSDSSVRQRNFYERSFGAFIIVIIGVGALESLPGLLDIFHDLVSREASALPALASMTAVAVTVFGVAPKILASLGRGVARVLVFMAVGALGLLIPLVGVLVASEFIVFGPVADYTFWPAVVGLFFPVAVLLGTLLGGIFGAFKRKDYAYIALLVLLGVGLIGLGTFTDKYVFSKHIEATDRLKEVAHAELLNHPSDVEKLIEVVAKQPGSKFERLADWAKETEAKEVCESSENELTQELADLGYAANICPQFGRLHVMIETLRHTCAGQASCNSALNREIKWLKDTATIVAGIRSARAQSMQALAHLVFYLSEDEVNILGASPMNDVDSNSIPGAGANGVVELRKEVRDYLTIGKKLRDVQREFATIASTSLQDTAFFATSAAKNVHANTFWPRFLFVAMVAVQLWALWWLTVDVNLTSIHGLYRDRLASAFLVRKSPSGGVEIEDDVNLMDICRHEAGSIAPYHLINVALNLQGSKDMDIRDRQSDFFVFSKAFIGGERTGYCRSENMERVFPQMDLATAMAISAAAASPNMGRGTSPALVAVMTLLNIRLGFWIPNPGRLEGWLAGRNASHKQESRNSKGYSFDDVFKKELLQIKARWAQLPEHARAGRRIAAGIEQTSLDHGLVGIGFSGGGIRSATLNLGITQALHSRGVFDHVDYMSTVSGGGYLGASISTLMRQRNESTSEPDSNPDALVADDEGNWRDSAGQVFSWRVRPSALLREILSRLDEKSRWVNVSDGGHIENLAGIELIRRRCRYIIIGDGEADVDHHFQGLATLIRTARIDLGVDIDINVASLRLRDDGRCRDHWAIGRIKYPDENKRGYLLYLKSSITGKEDEVICEYRNKHASFPHESTADQFFGEGQFEAYRSLGQHCAQAALDVGAVLKDEKTSYADFEAWFRALDKTRSTTETA